MDFPEDSEDRDSIKTPTGNQDSEQNLSDGENNQLAAFTGSDDAANDLDSSFRVLEAVGAAPVDLNGTEFEFPEFMTNMLSDITNRGSQDGTQVGEIAITKGESSNGTKRSAQQASLDEPSGSMDHGQAKQGNSLVTAQTNSGRGPNNVRSVQHFRKQSSRAMRGPQDGVHSGSMGGHPAPLNGQIRTIATESRIEIYASKNPYGVGIASTSTTQMNAAQEDDWRIRTIKSEPKEQKSTGNDCRNMTCQPNYLACSYGQNGTVMNPAAAINPPLHNAVLMNADKTPLTQWNSTAPMYSQQRTIQSTCMMNAAQHRIRETPHVPQQYSYPVAGVSMDARPSKIRKRVQQDYSIPQEPQKLPYMVHREGNYFYATTECQNCKNKKEHTLYNPGHWPPTQCCFCGGKCIIVDWKHYATETDDDIVFLGEFIPSSKPQPRNNQLNMFYQPNRIKSEPVEEAFNRPSCRQCGGHHAQIRGQPYNPGYCPQYGRMMGNPTFTAWRGK